MTLEKAIGAICIIVALAVVAAAVTPATIINNNGGETERDGPLFSVLRFVRLIFGMPTPMPMQQPPPEDEHKNMQMFASEPPPEIPPDEPLEIRAIDTGVTLSHSEGW